MRGKIKNIIFTVLLFLLQMYIIGILNQLAFSIMIGIELITVYIMLQWTVLITIYLLLRRENGKIDSLGIQKEKVGLQVVIGCLMGIGLLCVYYIVPDLIRQTPVFLNNFHIDIGYGIYYIFGIAVSEETLFRGYLYNKIKELFDSEWLSIILSAVIFGLFHMLNGNIYQVVLATSFGIILCILRYKKCTLLSLIIAHGIYGAIGTQIFTPL